MFKGWVTVQQTRDTTGAEIIRQGLKDYMATNAENCLSGYRNLLAETYLVTGQLEAGLAVLGQAVAFMQRSDEHFIEAEIHRLKGELLLAQGDDRQAEAEAAFQHALTVARRQQAKSLELRAATSLARLWQRQGKIEPAHALLSEIYGWFTEGFDTPDLQDAKQLLAQLSPRE
jgi:predicted ATPase